MSVDTLLKKFSSDVSLHFAEEFGYAMAKPLWVYISVSHACTYRCQMCGVVDVLKEHTLETALVKKVLDEIAQWEHKPTVVFTGGETFLQKDIFSLISYSASRGITTEAVSNGSRVNEELARRIIGSGLSNIAISVDGAYAATHDRVRQRGAFAQACIAISLLAAEKKRKGAGPQISMWTTIMKENVRELSAMIPLAKGHGVECLVYHPVVAAQVDMQHTSADAPFWVRGKDLEVLEEEIGKLMRYQKESGMIAFLHDPYLWMRYFQGTLTRKDWRCNPFAFISIGPDGEVRSCGNPFGSIKRHSLRACLESRQAHGVRKQMKACAKPCLQTCWANPDSDSLEKSVAALVRGAKAEGIKGKERGRLLRGALEVLRGYEFFCEEQCKD